MTEERKKTNMEVAEEALIKVRADMKTKAEKEAAFLDSLDFSRTTNTFIPAIKDFKLAKGYNEEHTTAVNMKIVVLEEKIDKLEERLRRANLKLKTGFSGPIEKTIKYRALKERFDALEAEYQALKEEFQSRIEASQEDNREEMLSHCYSGIGFAEEFTAKMADYFFIGIESIKKDFAAIIKCLR